MLDELGRAGLDRTGPAELDWAAGIRTGPNGPLEFGRGRMGRWNLNWAEWATGPDWAVGRAPGCCWTGPTCVRKSPGMTRRSSMTTVNRQDWGGPLKATICGVVRARACKENWEGYEVSGATRRKEETREFEGSVHRRELRVELREYGFPRARVRCELRESRYGGESPVR
ncbi:hypothetical protein CDL15_Pgr017734 [Punica granatum]|uniref:Uncharacterized protein n=1 Tax=Punica granatum TaxID=22663 RepID=A0A218WHZ7_PUNGR|nr:hypothetical protein CDL15_Pgr017734 [Punica granatum]